MIDQDCGVSASGGDPSSFFGRFGGRFLGGRSILWTTDVQAVFGCPGQMIP